MCVWCSDVGGGCVLGESRPRPLKIAGEDEEGKLGWKLRRAWEGRGRRDGERQTLH
jgi:hypothetical protein